MLANLALVPKINFSPYEPFSGTGQDSPKSQKDYDKANWMKFFAGLTDENFSEFGKFMKANPADAWDIVTHSPVEHYSASQRRILGAMIKEYIGRTPFKTSEKIAQMADELGMTLINVAARRPAYQSALRIRKIKEGMAAEGPAAPVTQKVRLEPSGIVIHKVAPTSTPEAEVEKVKKVKTTKPRKPKATTAPIEARPIALRPVVELSQPETKPGIKQKVDPKILESIEELIPALETKLKEAASLASNINKQLLSRVSDVREALKQAEILESLKELNSELEKLAGFEVTAPISVLRVYSYAKNINKALDASSFGVKELFEQLNLLIDRVDKVFYRK